MAWVAVNRDNTESIFKDKPRKVYDWWVDKHCIGTDEWFNSKIALPEGSIKKLIGKELTWEDEPVKLEEE